ncbi:MAG TPA: RES family NAD+ phosphorylase [Roseiarcus sp.]|nr:RES family NAD+ phosphorylase [Roseiarcus sp.]
MSSLTLTPAERSSELREYKGKVWRIVEAQHRVSTRKLVDSNAEQGLLETLIDQTKPAVPEDCRELDYLLWTPFRYGTYSRGSRFRRAGRTPGVFYASEDPMTAAAELALHRLLFFAESPATPWPANPGEYTGFSSFVASSRSLDLTGRLFDAAEAIWRHPVDYEPCQELADAARDAGAQILRRISARDPLGGACAAVLTCAAFLGPASLEYQTWRIGVGPSGT